MRVFRTAVLVVMSALVATSCAFGTYVHGNGTVSTESRSTQGFDSVIVEGAGALRIHKGVQSVAIISDTNILPHITTTVSGTTLTIAIEQGFNISSPTALEYELSLPSLAAVTISGSCDASVDSFSGASFKGVISGSGGMRATLAYSSAHLGVSGSGGAYLQGSAEAIDIDIAGSGGIDAAAFDSKNATVDIAGSGNVSLKVSESLDASLYGVGGLRYWGSPTVSTRVLGLGSVVRAGD